MLLTYEEVDDLLTSIFTGTKVEYINISDSYVIFKHPNNYLKLAAKLTYNRSYKEALKEGFLSIEALEHLIERRRFFTDLDKQKVIKLQNQIEAQEVLLSKTTKVRARIDRVKTTLDNLKNELATIQFKRNSKLIMSAEAKAEDAKNHFLCQNCVFKLDGTTLFWKSNKALCEELNIDLKSEILQKLVLFQSGINTETIRFLARHGSWRIRYVNSCKTGEALFGVATSDYTTDQLNLVYWTNFYSNIYEMMPENRPSDSVIEDDTALDAFMQNYYDEQLKELSEARGRSNTTGKLSAFDKEEVIITQSNELYQDIKYDKPREANQIKNRVDIKKRTCRS